MLTVLAVVGTRPEAIKMAPVIAALKRAPWCRCVVVATAQHRQMLDQVFDMFGIEVDGDLDVMREAQTLSGLSAELFRGLDAVLAKWRPDVVIAQGDTTTVMVAAVAAFYRRIPFAHVEAGLRTGDMYNPFPEEFNRIVAGRIAALHFAPTQGAELALLSEGVAPESIVVTGNTVVDALLAVAARPAKLPVTLPSDCPLILLTAHRRESFGRPLTQVFKSVLRVVRDFPSVHVLYPVHPNPNVKLLAYEMLGQQERIHLLEPLDYEMLVGCLRRCSFVLTDSGGLQEEAPALGKPVLVLRNETERPEAIMAGVASLVGTGEDVIYEAAKRLLTDKIHYRSMAKAISPYGDGKASERIVTAIEQRYCEELAEQALA